MDEVHFLKPKMCSRKIRGDLQKRYSVLISCSHINAVKQPHLLISIEMIVLFAFVYPISGNICWIFQCYYMFVFYQNADSNVFKIWNRR
jgi:hypothetical protein